MIKKLWNDPVWSKVIAGVILTVCATIGAYFLNWLPIIWRCVENIWAFCLSRSVVPNWLFGLLTILALPAIIAAGAFVWAKIFPSQDTKPDWRVYTNDTFFGLRWRWSYFSDGAISNICSFCPHCDFQVFPYHAGVYRVIERIGFRCDSCGRDLGEFDISYNTLESKVERSIQQKLRNGTWVGA